MFAPSLGEREIDGADNHESRAEAARYVAPRVLELLGEMAYHLPAEKGEEKQRHRVSRGPRAVRRERREILRAHRAERRKRNEKQHGDDSADDAKLRPPRKLDAAVIESRGEQRHSRRHDVGRVRPPAEKAVEIARAYQRDGRNAYRDGRENQKAREPPHAGAEGLLRVGRDAARVRKARRHLRDRREHRQREKPHQRPRDERRRPGRLRRERRKHENPRADDRAYRHRRPLKPSYLTAEPSVFVVHDNVTSIV